MFPSGGTGSFLEVCLTSAVAADERRGLPPWLRARVCGGPAGKAVPGEPCQFRVAWTVGTREQEVFLQGLPASGGGDALILPSSSHDATLWLVEVEKCKSFSEDFSQIKIVHT